MNDNYTSRVQSNKDHKVSNVCKGQYGEELAAIFLQEQGYQIVFRNFYSRYGELDIVAKKNHLLSFVEVKTRTGENYGTPAEAITPKKRQHMTCAAKFFIQRFGLYQMDFRFDVIEVSLNHLENV